MHGKDVDPPFNTPAIATTHGTYTAQITAGKNSSTVVVTHPFLGLNPNYPKPFGTTTTDPAYYQFQLGDLWESWGMDNVQGYTNFTWDVQWGAAAGVGVGVGVGVGAAAAADNGASAPPPRLGFTAVYDNAIAGLHAAVLVQGPGHAQGMLTT
jgi:hypothetical protein